MAKADKRETDKRETGMFLKQLLENCIAAGCVDPDDHPAGAGARVGRKRMIAVPMANNEEVIRCIATVNERELADFLLIGDRTAIERTAEHSGVALGNVTFVAAGGSAEACTHAAQLAAEGRADVLMKGLVQTAEFTRAILSREHHLLGPGALISHVAVFDIPRYHKTLLITDAAINVAPDAEQKIVLIANAVRVARSIGIMEPKIACVAPVEKVSQKVPSTVAADSIVRRFESGEFTKMLGPVQMIGPVGLDVAISAEAAQIKGIGGPVAGNADILLMPNLEAANALYKSLTSFSDARVAGIVAGARVPVVLTSRADTEESKYLSVLLALAGAGVSAER